jgi:hypothetical protein
LLRKLTGCVWAWLCSCSRRHNTFRFTLVNNSIVCCLHPCVCVWCKVLIDIVYVQCQCWVIGASVLLCATTQVSTLFCHQVVTTIHCVHIKTHTFMCVWVCVCFRATMQLYIFTIFFFLDNKTFVTYTHLRMLKHFANSLQICVRINCHNSMNHSNLQKGCGVTL